MLRKTNKMLKRNKRKQWIRGAIILTCLSFLLGYFFVVRPALAIRSQLSTVTSQANQVRKAFSQSDLDLVSNELTTFKDEYDVLQRTSSKVSWMRFVPFLGGYVSDYFRGIKAGESLIEASILSIESIAPYADLIGFKKGEEGSFTEKSAEERIQTAVLTLDKLVTEIDDIAIKVENARNEIDKIETKKYPESFFGRSVRSLLEDGIARFDAVAGLFVDSKPLIKQLPQIMGSDREKIYLVLFQNDKELRPTGGFLTAYAIFRINQGKIRVERSQDIYSLDASIRVHPKAPDEILTYHKNVSKFYIRDSNLSPDFVKSVALFNGLYEMSDQRIDYDGIIAVDTEVLVSTLNVLGDTEVRGTVFSSEMDKRCDCPQVIYKLLDEIDRPVAYIKEDRKGILGDLLFALFQKAMGFSPSKYWGTLSQVLLTDLQEKHILVYFTDPQIQESVEKLNFAGRMQSVEGDFLHINDTNFAGAKSNLFVEHSIISDTYFEENSSVIRKLVLTYRNPYEHSDCNLERGGLCINATLRNWLRVYVPEGSTLNGFTGSKTKIKEYKELGKTVFEGFVTVEPLSSSTVEIEYTLPESFREKKDYKLYIQKQPGTSTHAYQFLLDGKKVSEFQLKKDIELTTQ